jgi:hypothetical protein
MLISKYHGAAKKSGAFVLWGRKLLAKRNSRFYLPQMQAHLHGFPASAISYHHSNVSFTQCISLKMNTARSSFNNKEKVDLENVNDGIVGMNRD